MSDAGMNSFNAYFDVMNFSDHITCPVITCFSLQDTTDPARTNLAPFNLLNKVKDNDKVYIINPFLGHATPADWGKKYMTFFEKYFSNNPPTAIRQTNLFADNGKPTIFYDLMGRRTLRPNKGIYIANGKKVLYK